jgi:ABC-type sugar transport system substrate-binding protein
VAGQRGWARTSLAVALALCLIGGCSTGGETPPAANAVVSPPTRIVSLILAVEDDPYARAVVAGARAEARRAGVALEVFDVDGKQAQRQQLYAAIQRQDQAVILAPVDYLDAYLLLRTAHDRGVPTFVLDVDPPPATNQAYVWSFLTTGRRAAVAAAARRLATRLKGSTAPVLIASSSDATPGHVDVARAELRRLLPGAPVRAVEVPAATTGAEPAPGLDGAGGVLATDERAAEVLIDAVTRRTWRGLLVAVGATADETAALRRGVVGALVAPRPAELGARAVRFAVVAAAHNPRLVPRTVGLDVVTLTRSNLDAATGRRAAYP